MPNTDTQAYNTHNPHKACKYVFVTGGVCSSLGKGLTAASLGSLLESRGYGVQIVKIDPYLNVDAGTMNPYQHGEVYVTDDGAETDLDLGNYARFTSAELSKKNSITTGQVYFEVIESERQGRYLGGTVQVVPHITDTIKKRIMRLSQQQGVDIVITEVGGTVGDIESVPFLEAIRQIIHENDSDVTCTIHVTLLPQLANNELKTKPTQHSVRDLRVAGIRPEFLICRSPVLLSQEHRSKLELLSDVTREGVISSYDVDNIYELPLLYSEQGLETKILKKFNLAIREPKLQPWHDYINSARKAKKTVRIAMVGKYVQLEDAYKSVDEALSHAATKLNAQLQLVKFDPELLEQQQEDEWEQLRACDGVLIPGGFGTRGVYGMLLSAEYARTQHIPFFGICLGLHIMVIEYSRNVLNLRGADSTEFKLETKHPVICLLSEQEGIANLGGTMRLGANDSVLVKDSKPYLAYQQEVISERHRHRYEVSNKYLTDLVNAGLMIAGKTADGSLVESMQWSGHPWGVGVQFHPEFKSRPIYPHPLFRDFIKYSLDSKAKRHKSSAPPHPTTEKKPRKSGTSS